MLDSIISYISAEDFWRRKAWKFAVTILLIYVLIEIFVPQLFIWIFIAYCVAGLVLVYIIGSRHNR